MLLRSIENRTSNMFSALHQHVTGRAKNILIQPIRHKNTVSTLNPRNDHFWAKKMKLFYKPRKPKEFDELLPMSYKCRKQFKLALRKLENGEEENPYERILANEIKEDLSQARMVLILHRNPVGGYDLFEAKKKFVKSGMSVITHGKKTVKMAVEDTKFANIMYLFQDKTETWLLACPEVKLNLALQLLKKMPFHILLAGIVDDKFLYRHELEKLGQIKNIDEIRAQLLATLNTPAVQLSQNLTQHQSTTITYLSEYIKMKSTADESTTSGTTKSGNEKAEVEKEK